MARELTGYSSWWRALWTLVAVIGVGLALLDYAWGVVVAGFILSLGIGIGLRASAIRPWLTPRPLSLAVAVTGAFGYLAFSPSLMVLLALLAFLTLPALVARVVAAGHRDVASTDEADEEALGTRLTTDESQGPLVGLDDRQLCRLWRESFWRLRGAPTGDGALRLVLLRQACLDELTRRHGPGVEAWLASGARPSSGPDKFLEP
ncbi:MAG: hypothetical protein JOZ82_04840 [Marmoricola sp.]|nr:hypothetical protein [Marmoricola sp.]